MKQASVSRLLYKTQPRELFCFINGKCCLERIYQTQGSRFRVPTHMCDTSVTQGEKLMDGTVVFQIFQQEFIRVNYTVLILIQCL